MAAPPCQMQSVYDSFPDDDSTKEVYFQAAGLTYSEISDRHVLLRWLNDELTEDVPITQVVQLTGQPGNYNYYAPVVVRSREPRTANLQITLGRFSRAQRDQILQLAMDVKFEKKFTVNSCRIWTRDLLEAMVGRGLISGDLFTDIDGEVPL